MVGGPVYFIRNIVYNASTGGGLKLSTSAGVQVFHNTFIADVQNAASSSRFFNNLILSTSGRRPVFASSNNTVWARSDYNGFLPNTNAQFSFEWDVPKPGVTFDYQSPPVVHRYETLTEYARESGQDTHSKLIDYSVFIRATAPDSDDLQRLYNPEDFDLRLTPGAAAIDAGMIMPNVNDGFAGAAPDLGAYEAGKLLPHYGPRSPPPGTPYGDGTLRSIAGPPAGK